MDAHIAATIKFISFEALIVFMDKKVSELRFQSGMEGRVILMEFLNDGTYKEPHILNSQYQCEEYVRKNYGGSKIKSLFTGLIKPDKEKLEKIINEG